MSIAGVSEAERETVRNRAGVDPNGSCVLYWMQRAQRATDNPALDAAIRAGNALGRPVVVFLPLAPSHPHDNLRHWRFLVDGLPELADGLARRGVGLVLRRHPDHSLLKLADELRPSLVIGDQDPLRHAEAARRAAATGLRVLFSTVDADVIVPSHLFAKEQFAARTMRPRLQPLLGRFLVHTPEPRARRRFVSPSGLQTLDPRGALLDGRFPIDRSLSPVALRGGSRAGAAALRRFVRERLTGYARWRNRPEVEGTSQLSPYLHAGQLGPRAVALEVASADAPAEDRAAFLEELIVRRELAINFVRFNPAYDRLEGCEPWARRTLDAHRGDPRPIALDEARLEAADSPDPLWNAAQRQMVERGWMHGYLRMYWAKKLLHWSPAPERAFELAVRWNDRYQLDGRDPNGYAGIAWACGGKHDRAWPERPIFGKVRCMSHASTSRKFDAGGYIARVSEHAHG